MTQQKITDLLCVKRRFLRSAHLERDFRDASALDGYVLTEEAKNHINRLASGLAPQSGQRAWRITGDYGSGKSSFALLLAQLFSDRFGQLPSTLQSAVDFIDSKKPNLLPVLVTGSRSGLSDALLSSLETTLRNVGGRAAKSIAGEVSALLSHPHGDITDRVIVDTVQRVCSFVIEHEKADGLLIVIDELGRFLEFAALRPEKQDVGLLQSLAELACRSGDKPLFVVGLLHQGFNAYAEHLSQSAQKEWEKIAGRFEELVFAQPLDQIARLVADAISLNMEMVPDECISAAKRAMEQTLHLGWYGAAPAKQSLAELSSRLFPLHPTVIPVLVRFFRRFGQNERSLFSFLLSNEEFALFDFCDKPLEGSDFYRLHDLYDYVRSAFGHRLATQSYRSHWGHIDSTIQSFANGDTLDIQVLKTVGLLNLLDQAPLLATKDAIVTCVADDVVSPEEVEEAIERLATKTQVLYRRGSAAGYCLWPFTSVNLDHAYEEAKQALGPVDRIAPLVRDYLHERPLVARRHYIETGNLRHFRVVYGGLADIQQLLADPSTNSDGLILVPLSETPQEHRKARYFAQSVDLENRPEVLVAVAQPLHGLKSLFQEVRIWEWIVSNTPELNHDSYAAEEVSRQIIASRQTLTSRVQSTVSVQHFASSHDVQWFRCGKQVGLASGRSVLEHLSNVCDETYGCSPIISNELINRRNLSSAAAAARMRLIERMFSNRFEPYLGMPSDKKPPEMSIYLSVLQRAGLHAEDGEKYDFKLPHDNDECRVIPAIKEIDRVLQQRPDARVLVSDVFDALRNRPFGVRDGLLPVLLAVYTLIHEQDVAFYENGSFLRHVDGLCFQRLLKRPELFEMQYCSVGGIRAELFEELLGLLGVKSGMRKQPDVLDVVHPLCTFAARLPQFVHKTHRLSSEAEAVRSVLLTAREPGPLLFDELPRACGVIAFRSDEIPNDSKVRDFVSKLERAVSELRSAYPDLCERLTSLVGRQFDMPGTVARMRAEISARAQRVMLYAKEPKLKTLCLRLADDSLSDTAWIESLGSYIVSKPPSKWVDLDESMFVQELAELAMRFRNVESMAFDKMVDHGAQATRVSITQLDGSETSAVVFITEEEERLVKDMESRIEAVVGDSTKVGKAALSRAMWRLLNTDVDSDSDFDERGGEE